ncbi:hypothetical protein [Mumia quercus]|uniref:hypothetical protein n=1 Tax=Mumia quercus TaxID=2976125 RepID=UPI0021CE4A29|nr:hypothetical protein [Mumia quercus]
MSMINAAARYRREDRQTMRVPVVMPLVEVDVGNDGFLTVTLDREPYSADGSLMRDDLKRVLDDIAGDLGTAVRVEVREEDKSTFTDIVTPERPKLRMIEPEREATTRIGEVAGGGFLPHEEVAVAVVVARQVANIDGTARLRLPPALLEAHPGLVVFMGKRSGTILVSGGAA